jgi:Pectate lyase superfamily protein
MPKQIPTSGSLNWAIPLNEHIAQLQDPTNGAINSFSQFSQRPTNLTANDVGKTYLYTQTGNLHQWSGTEWKVLNNSDFNVRDYGAIGDGVADDTNAIQTCIDISQLNFNGPTVTNGICVFFPTGKYLCGTINLTGEGGLQLRGVKSGYAYTQNSLPSECTVIKLKNNTSLVQLNITISGGPITIDDITFLAGDNTITGDQPLITTSFMKAGVDSGQLSQGRIRGCRFFNYGRVFDCKRFYDVTIDNCGFEFCANVFNVVSSGFFSNNYISNCVIFECKKFIELKNNSSFELNVITNCNFFNGDFTLSSGVIGTETSTTIGKFNTNLFSNCIFDYTINNETTGDLVRFDGGFVEVQRTKFSNCSFSGANIVLNQASVTPADKGNFIISGSSFDRCKINATSTDTININASNFVNSTISTKNSSNCSFTSNIFTRNLSLSTQDITIDNVNRVILTSNIFTEGVGGIEYLNQPASNIKVDINNII